MIKAARSATAAIFAAALSLTALSFQAPANSATASTEPKVLQQAKFVSTGNQLQQFIATVNIADADVGRPLTLSFFNGPENAPKFVWVRVFMGDQMNQAAGRPGKPVQPSGRMIVNETSFKTTNRVDLNLTGQVQAGHSTTLVINGAGLKGATIGYVVTTPPPGAMQVTSVSPALARSGGALTISGAGFSSTPANNAVYFNQTKATVTQATATSLQVEVPSKLVAGEYSLVVSVNGIKAAPYGIKVAGMPELTRTDWLAGPCGSMVTIFGKNFSDNAADNTVFFGKTKASVMSASADSITVTVPQFPELDGNTAYMTPTPFDITVTVGTTPAKGHLVFTSAKVGWKE